VIGLLLVKIFLDLSGRVGYCSLNVLLERFLQSRTFRGIINIENTLQASVTVRCRIAQTGGFIILRGRYAL